jgi:hypothetical protein
MVSLPLSEAKVWQAAAAGAMQREEVDYVFQESDRRSDFSRLCRRR